MASRTEINETKCLEESAAVIPVEIALTSGVMTLAVLFAPVERGATTALNVAMLLGFIGFVSFLAAKISLLGSGRFASWGATPMRVPFKLAYFAGYSLMALSTLATFEIIL